MADRIVHRDDFIREEDTEMFRGPGNEDLLRANALSEASTR